MRARDLSARDFHTACARSGFEPEMLGYYRLPLPGHHIAVNVLNAGDRRRDRLAYLHQQLAKHEARIAAEAECAAGTVQAVVGPAR
jgi:hypothetical protein